VEVELPELERSRSLDPAKFRHRYVRRLASAMFDDPCDWPWRFSCAKHIATIALPSYERQETFTGAALACLRAEIYGAQKSPRGEDESSRPLLTNNAHSIRVSFSIIHDRLIAIACQWSGLEPVINLVQHRRGRDWAQRTNRHSCEHLDK
jgi:hypothetical protein